MNLEEDKKLIECLAALLLYCMSNFFFFFFGEIRFQDICQVLLHGDNLFQ